MNAAQALPPFPETMVPLAVAELGEAGDAVDADRACDRAYARDFAGAIRRVPRAH